MQNLSTSLRGLPAIRLNRQAAVCRRPGAIASVIIVLGLTFSSQAFGQQASTIDLSPLVAESSFLSAADPAKEISVVLSLPLGDSQGRRRFCPARF